MHGDQGLVPTSLVIDRELWSARSSSVLQPSQAAAWSRAVWGGSWSAACRVGLGEVAGDRLGSRAGVALQGADRGVSRAGQQQGQVGAVLGGVGERRMA